MGRIEAMYSNNIGISVSLSLLTEIVLRGDFPSQRILVISGDIFWFGFDP